MLKIKPIISRIGGKTRLAKDIVEIINQYKWSSYIEPFCGSCIVYLKLLETIQEDKRYVFVLNDKDDNIYNLFKVLREYPEELIYQVELTPYSRKEHAKSKIDVGEHIEKARKFLVKNKQSFSADDNGGWRFDVKTQRQLIKSTWLTIPDKLKCFLETLKLAYIECDDFEKVCRRFDAPTAIHYLDPPYFNHEHYYNEKFTQDDHRRLAKMAHELKGNVIISYYPIPIIDELYNDDKWNKIEIIKRTCADNSNKSENSRKKETELLLVRK